MWAGTFQPTNQHQYIVVYRSADNNAISITYSRWILLFDVVLHWPVDIHTYMCFYLRVAGRWYPYYIPSTRHLRDDVRRHADLVKILQTTRQCLKMLCVRFAQMSMTTRSLWQPCHVDTHFMMTASASGWPTPETVHHAENHSRKHSILSTG